MSETGGESLTAYQAHLVAHRPLPPRGTPPSGPAWRLTPPTRHIPGVVIEVVVALVAIGTIKAPATTIGTIKT